MEVQVKEIKIIPGIQTKYGEKDMYVLEDSAGNEYSTLNTKLQRILDGISVGTTLDIVAQKSGKYTNLTGINTGGDDPFTDAPAPASNTRASRVVKKNNGGGNGADQMSKEEWREKDALTRDSIETQKFIDCAVTLLEVAHKWDGKLLTNKECKELAQDVKAVIRNHMRKRLAPLLPEPESSSTGQSEKPEDTSGDGFPGDFADLPPDEAEKAFKLLTESGQFDVLKSVMQEITEDPEKRITALELIEKHRESKSMFSLYKKWISILEDKRANEAPDDEEIPF